MSLPTFLVIGAAKSGTTSLYHYLGQHPDIFVSPVKEPGFFAFEGHDLNFEGPGDHWMRQTVTTTMDAYLSNFKDVTVEHAIGECSPVYLYSANAPQRIRLHIPNAGLIAILRDPVERAYSQFLFFVQCGREPLRDFEAALASEEERIAGNWAWGWHYTQVGFYYEQLRRYYDLFDPAQIKILLHEDLNDDPRTMLKNTFRFLGVDEAFKADLGTRYNPTNVHRSRTLEAMWRQPNPIRSALKAVTTPVIRSALAKSRWFIRLTRHRPTLSDETARRLALLYRDDILRLQDLIDRDLSAWLP